MSRNAMHVPFDKMGIRNSKVLNLQEIMEWVASDHHLRVDYPDDIEDILLNEVLILLKDIIHITHSHHYRSCIGTVRIYFPVIFSGKFDGFFH